VNLLLKEGYCWLKERPPPRSQFKDVILILMIILNTFLSQTSDTAREFLEDSGLSSKTYTASLATYCRAVIAT
jgi:hypothetical protein